MVRVKKGKERRRAAVLEGMSISVADLFSGHGGLDGGQVKI